MGKRMIFKGENFSADAMPIKDPTWYLNYDEARMEGNTVIIGSNTFYMKTSEIASLELTGKEVQYVKIFCAIAGNINICKINTLGTTGSIISTETRSVTQGLNVIHLRNSFALGSGVSIGFSGGNIISIYNYQGTNPIGWAINRAGSDAEYPSTVFPIDLGYLDI